MRRSALYLGRVRHRRYGAPEHAFEVPVWYALLDLDELDGLDAELRLFSHNRFNLTSFDDRDHLGPAPGSVRDKLADWLRDQGVEIELGRVALLTHLRIVGQVFNPVSWFFVYDRTDRLRHVVAEVNNTFGEGCCYLLRASGDVVRDEALKTFHVSPFQPVAGRYSFRVTPPRERMTVHIDLVRDGERAFDSTLAVGRRALTDGTLLRTVARHPHLGLRTLGLIHYQALRLWLKRAPFFAKPDRPARAWRTRHG